MKKSQILGASVLSISVGVGLAAYAQSGDFDISQQIGPNPVLPDPAPSLLPDLKVAEVVGWKDGETPAAPNGLTVTAYAKDLANPRTVHTLPNGDVLVVQARGPSGEPASRPKDLIRGWIMARGSAIINTTSIQSRQPSPQLLAYASTKGAISNFTAGLAEMLGERGIRVNAVAPGPIWTPLIPSTMPAKKAAKFGENTLIGRAGQPAELAGAYVLLASDLGSYMSASVVVANFQIPWLVRFRTNRFIRKSAFGLKIILN